MQLHTTVYVSVVRDFKALNFQFITKLCSKVLTLNLAQTRNYVYILLPLRAFSILFSNTALKVFHNEIYHKNTLSHHCCLEVLMYKLRV